MQRVARIEPPSDESIQRQNELHPASCWEPTPETKERGRETGGSGGDKAITSSGRSAEEMAHQFHHQEYSRYSVHIVTQYYVPSDPRRALEVRLFQANVGIVR